MTDKPTALRLADELEKYVEVATAIAAVAELRRLHEVVQHLLRERNINLESAQRDTARIAELEKQRNELLEALKGIIKAEHSEGRGGSGFIPKAPTLEHQQRVYQAWQKAHAAIAKVEGEKQ